MGRIIRRKEPLRKTTAALLLSWEEDVDDFHTTDEVSRLESLLKYTFRYTVSNAKIGAELPHSQVTKYLSDFVDDWDSPDTLLIVYYIGHGIPRGPGELHLSGYTLVKSSSRGLIADVRQKEEHESRKNNNRKGCDHLERCRTYSSQDSSRCLCDI